MEVEVVERRENPLLSREEVILKVRRDTTPSRKEARELVAANTGAPLEMIIVKRIGGRSGTHEFYVEAYVYKDPDVMKVLEPEYILRRNGVISDGEAQSQ